MTYKKLLNNLPSFLEKEQTSNNYKLMFSVGDVLDDIKTEINNLNLSIKVSSATGNDLDDIGLLFKLNRIQGESDNDFRNRILTFWFIAKGGGTKQSIIDAILRTINIDSNNMIYFEVEPLIFGFNLYLSEEEMLLDFDEMKNIVEYSKAAGTYCIFNHYLQNDLFKEEVEVRDIITILDSLDSGIFISDISSVGYTTAVPTTSSYQFGYGTYGISLFDGEDLIY